MDVYFDSNINVYADNILLAGAGPVSRPHLLLLLSGTLRAAAAVGALARGAGAGGSGAATTVLRHLVQSLCKLLSQVNGAGRWRKPNLCTETSSLVEVNQAIL